MPSYPGMPPGMPGGMPPGGMPPGSMPSIQQPPVPASSAVISAPPTTNTGLSFYKRSHEKWYF